MVRIVIFVLLVGLIYLLVRSYFLPGQEEGGGQGSMEMVQDPNCQIYLPRTEAFERTKSGEKLYFCSEKCADEYKESSEDF